MCDRSEAHSDRSPFILGCAECVAEADAGERQDVLTTEERQELARLRRETRQLRQEREILKAAATFFAKENA
jgi:transposase-like protein